VTYLDPPYIRGTAPKVRRHVAYLSPGIRTEGELMRTRMIVAGLAATPTGAGTAIAVAAPQAVRCGATLTTDAHLTRDLRCAAGEGITLVGDVTLDLGGHRILGPGRSGDGSVGRGVTVSAGPATVLNGTVQGWDTALGRDDALDDQPAATVRDVRLLDNGTGVDVVQQSVTLERVTVAGNASGVQGFLLATVTLTDSVVRDNDTGVNVVEGQLTVTGSRLTGNGMAVACSEGVCLLDHNRIADNDVAVISFSTGPRLTGNDVAGNHVGYESAGLDGPVLDGNRFTRNDVAVAVGSRSRVTIRQNTFTGNGSGVSASEDAEDYSGTLVGNTFTRNGDGVNLPASPETLSLGGNRAVRNTGWGIYAPGATDLGGNAARGNGNSPQCVGVAC
jgi:hypothetical protein